LVWIAFLGAVAVTWRGQHLRMDMLLQALPRPARRAVIGLEIAVMAVVTGFVGLQSFSYVAKLFALGTVSDILGVPTWIPHSAVCLSLTCMALIALRRATSWFAGVEAR
jgi:TRAP-type C4-dicarboxylate transport system permease small subunit